MWDTRFMAVPAQGGVVAELAALVPDNPFATENYFESRRQLGYTTWVLGLRDGAGGLVCGCGAFLSNRRLNHTLVIQSLPQVGADSLFWDGLREFCRHHRVTRLALNTYGSPLGVEIPALGSNCMWRSRCEFVLDLQGDLYGMLHRRHKKLVKKALEASLVLRRTRSTEAASIHRALISRSMDRRRARGEGVPWVGTSSEFVALLKSGAGELYQALSAEGVLSSLLVLRAAKGAHGHSAGTSPEGMAVGASHFLLHSIATQLKAEGMQAFDLGSADEGSGLALYKEGFGASRREPLPSASCYVGPLWLRRANCTIESAVELIHFDRKSVLRLLKGRISPVIVYAANTASVRPPEPQAGLACRALTVEDLHDLSVGDPSFRERQLDRLVRFGASYAYAVFLDGQIAHVSWLLPPAAMERDVPRWLRARADEADITASETLPQYRGRGMYGFAIRSLLEVARAQGVRRVFLQVALDNKASQSGLAKVESFGRVGWAMVIDLPGVQRPLVLPFFRR